MQFLLVVSAKDGVYKTRGDDPTEEKEVSVAIIIVLYVISLRLMTMWFVCMHDQKLMFSSRKASRSYGIRFAIYSDT